MYFIYGYFICAHILHFRMGRTTHISITKTSKKSSLWILFKDTFNIAYINPCTILYSYSLCLCNVVIRTVQTANVPTMISLTACIFKAARLITDSLSITIIAELIYLLFVHPLINSTKYSLHVTINFNWNCKIAKRHRSLEESEICYSINKWNSRTTKKK